MSLSTSFFIVICLFGSCTPEVTTLDLISSKLEDLAEKQASFTSTMNTLLRYLNRINQNIEGLEDTLLTQHEQLENLKLSVGRCSTNDQISTFHDLLATDACERNASNCSIYAKCRAYSPIHFECSCMAGYSGDGVICEDIDECKDDSNVCGDEEVCINLPGNYTCSCQEGYEKHGDICYDIDECSMKNNCSAHASCTNIPGGFTCKCSPDREGDGYTCKPKGFVCTSPRLELLPLGCIALVEENLKWSEAQVQCNAVGGDTLLYGFTTKQQLITIGQHVRAHFSHVRSPWVGIRGGFFVRIIDDGPFGWSSFSFSIDNRNLWGEGQPQGVITDNTQCGVVVLDPSDPYLWDGGCSAYSRPSLCQILY